MIMNALFLWRYRMLILKYLFLSIRYLNIYVFKLGFLLRLSVRPENYLYLLVRFDAFMV